MRRSGEGLGLSSCCFASALILSLCLSAPNTCADRIKSSPAESATKSEPSLTEQIDGFAFLHAPSAPWIDDFRTRSKLTGDWDGRRDVLADNGLTFIGDVTQFYQGVTAGGLEQRFRYGGRGDYLANIDTKKIGLWEGGHHDLRGETRLGQDCNEIDGAVALSNFAMAIPRRGQDDTALTGLQYTQDLSENLSVFAGKLNLLDGTQASYARGPRLNYFWNTAMQLNLSRSYLFPSILGAGFTVRDEVEPIFNFYLLDTHYNPTTTGLSTLFANGMVAYGEYRLRTNWFDLPGHSAAGFLYSTATRTSLDGNPNLLLEAILAGDPLPTRNSAWTATYRLDQVVYANTKDPRRNWTVNGFERCAHLTLLACCRPLLLEFASGFIADEVVRLAVHCERCPGSILRHLDTCDRIGHQVAFLIIVVLVQFLECLHKTDNAIIEPFCNLAIVNLIQRHRETGVLVEFHKDGKNIQTPIENQILHVHVVGEAERQINLSHRRVEPHLNLAQVLRNDRLNINAVLESFDKHLQAWSNEFHDPF